MANEMSTASGQAAMLMARTFALVKACPVGCVTTYGWLARAIGYPRGARMVGWFMHESPQDVPAQRVINSRGELSGSWAFGSPERMRQLLEEEGIVFNEQGRVDLKRYGWDPAYDLSPEELHAVLDSAASSQYDASPKLLAMMRRDPSSPFRGLS
jgi:methylated-DNA-protein-cysteine methyltransferase-like protein